MRSRAALGFTLASLAFAAGAGAQTDAERSAAREVGTRGVEAYQKEDYATASEKLEKAYQVLKVPSIGLWSARALAKTGKLVKASERYQEVTRLGLSQGQVDVQKQAQADAASELAQLTPRLPGVVIQIEPAAPDAKLTIDGAAVSAAMIGERLPVDPGSHTIDAAAAAGSAQQQVSVVEGESKTIVLHLQGSSGAAPSAPPSAAPNGAVPPGPVAPADTSAATASSNGGTQKVLAIAALGVGVVGLGVGTVFGLQAKSKNDQAKDAHCAGSTCPTNDGVDLSKDAAKFGNLSTVGFIVGGVGLAAGATLWLTAGPSSTQVGVGPGLIQLRRTF